MKEDSERLWEVEKKESKRRKDRAFIAASGGMSQVSCLCIAYAEVSLAMAKLWSRMLRIADSGQNWHEGYSRGLSSCSGGIAKHCCGGQCIPQIEHLSTTPTGGFR